MNLFKKIFIPILFLIFSNILISKDKLNKTTKVFKGAFFEIEYPKDFTVKPSIKSNIPKKYDSAFFISPDKKVKFYVFSPQWTGDATDILIDPKTEIEKDKKSENAGNKKQIWFSYKSKSSENTRSFHEILNDDGPTQLIFGIEYENQATYDKHKQSYLNFKKSIKQFAD